jgi:hypothetical protein
MATKNIMLEISIVVDTDIESVDDIVDNLDIEIKPNSENVEMCGDYSLDNFYDFDA